MKEQSLQFCGLRFSGLAKDAILESPEPFQQVVTVGAEFIIEAHRNERLRRIIDANVATFDGQVPYAIARRKHPGRAFEKISGADFIYDVCARARERGERIFLLGGYPQSNAGSIEKMRAMGIEADGMVTGFIPYPFPQERLEQIRERIRSFAPNYLFVGLGMCKQEYFIDENRDFLAACGVRIAVGSGGTFEVFSGMIRRAPVWMQRAGLEGLYRVLSEPNFKRFKRLASTLKFLKYIDR